VTMVIVVGLLLASCSWPWDSQKTAPAPGPEVTVEFPDAGPQLKAKVELQEPTQEMRRVVPAGFTVRDVASLTMAEGSFPASGAAVTFNLPEPLAAEQTAMIAHWDDEEAAWEPVPTELSADRKTLTASVEHFSLWGWIVDAAKVVGDGLQTGSEYAYNGIGRVLGEKTDPPECDGDIPRWADPVFSKDNMNAPVLWCAGTDSKNPDIMVMKLALNRGTAASITTAIKPAWAYSNLWENMTPKTWGQMAVQTNASTNQLGDTYLVQPLGEYHFGFHRAELMDFWYGHQTTPLIQVDSTLTYTLAGLMYQAVEGKASGNMAGVFIMASLLECGGGIVGAAVEQSVGDAFGALTSCLDERKDAIAVATARGLNLSPGADWDEAVAAGKNIGRIIRVAGLWYTAAKLSFTAASYVGDLGLEPILRQVIFSPATDELKRYVAARKPQLKTFSDAEMGVSFKYPAEWTVQKPTDPRIKTGAKVLDGSGQEMAEVNFSTSFDFQPCPPMPYQLLDSTPVTIPGMDTSAAPTTIKTELFDIGAQSSYWPDKKPIRLGVTVYSGPGQPAGTTMACNVIGVIKHDGKYGFFWSNHGFDAVQDAKAFVATEEYGQIKAMLATLRFL
jgi:hypothetical protein